MSKWKSKYGKSRWINTRLSKPYKSRKAFAYIQCAQISMQAASQVSMMSIYGVAATPNALEVIINSLKAMNEAMESARGRVKA